MHIGPDGLEIDSDETLADVQPVIAMWLAALPQAQTIDRLTTQLTTGTADLEAAEHTDHPLPLQGE